VVVSVQNYYADNQDTFTLTLEPPTSGAGTYAFGPGQFNMLYVFGVGEAPISLSGDPADTAALVHTIRAVGPVTDALGRLRPGDRLGLRGPFGSCWPLEAARGCDVVLVSGGIGLAPLRPAIYHLLRHRKDYGRVILLQGARTPRDLIYAEELARWSGRADFRVLITVDQADEYWHGHVGVVTRLFTRAEFDPQRTVGLMCGPEVMMRFALQEFAERGVSEDRLYVSLERNMHCAVGFCGHCQFGPTFVCMNGPVFRYDQVRTFFHIREA
jgi:NAD(P)H-flavin reductase